jgi:ribosomal protein S19E (S16A)
MPVQQSPAWDTVIPQDATEVRRLEELEEQAAGERIRDAVQQLEKAGIIDDKGRRVSQDLPQDMREGSTCEL